MNQITEKTIEQMVATIVREFQPEMVILFGSHSQGDAHPGSDVDLLIVDSKPFGPAHSRRKETARIWRALGRFLTPVDILLYSRDEIEKWRNSLNHVIAHALREGKVLYERR